MAALPVAAMTMLASRAEAAIAFITYTGTVSESYDGSGVFGGGLGSSYEGDPIKIVFTLDTTKGLFSEGCEASTGRCYEQISGNPPSSPLTADITINNTTIHYDDYGDADFAASDSTTQHGLFCGGACSYRSDYIADDFGNKYLDVEAYALSDPTLFPLSLVSPFDITLDDFGYNAGNFAFYNDGLETYASFSTDHVSLTLPAAVPEPAAWSLMIGGFGIAGGALRSRRRAPAIA